VSWLRPKFLILILCDNFVTTKKFNGYWPRSNQNFSECFKLTNLKIKFLKGLCHQCYTSGVELVLTEVSKNDAGISEIPLCDKCRN